MYGDHRLGALSRFITPPRHSAPQGACLLSQRLGSCASQECNAHHASLIGSLSMDALFMTQVVICHMLCISQRVLVALTVELSCGSPAPATQGPLACRPESWRARTCTRRAAGSCGAAAARTARTTPRAARPTRAGAPWPRRQSPGSRTGATRSRRPAAAGPTGARPARRAGLLLRARPRPSQGRPNGGPALAARSVVRPYPSLCICTQYSPTLSHPALCTKQFLRGGTRHALIKQPAPPERQCCQTL
jgi:hypothetical protein